MVSAQGKRSNSYHRIKWEVANRKYKSKSVDVNSSDCESLTSNSRYQSSKSNRGNSKKFEHAVAFIDLLVKESFTDTTAVGESSGKRYIPYKKIIHFYAAYIIDNELSDVSPEETCSLTTFRRAWKKVKKEQNLHLSSGKGTKIEIENIRVVLLKC